MKQALNYLICAFAFMFTTPRSSADPNKPNIVIIQADDMGIGDVGVYGMNDRIAAGLPSFAMPNIDSLATAGVRFNHMYANPMSKPTRCTIFTGFHQGHCKGDRNSGTKSELRGDLSADGRDITFADVIRAGGYTTGHFGKWHVGVPNSTGAYADLAVSAMPRLGFDEALNLVGYRKTEFQEDDTTNNGMKTTANIQVVEGDGSTQWKYNTFIITEQSEDFIQSHANDVNPFFAYINYFNVHRPVAEVPRPHAFEGETTWPAVERDYAATAVALDVEVGKILARLDDPDGDGNNIDSITNNTLVIFFSDNGNQTKEGHSAEFFNSNLHYRKFKFHVEEGGIKTPFIARWPGVIEPNTINDSHVGTVADFVPTFAELTGQEAPLGVDGKSMWNTLSNQGTSDRPDIYVWHSFNQKEWAVRVLDYKLIRNATSGAMNLYNVRTDQGEANDLIGTRTDIRDALLQIGLDQGAQSDADLSSQQGNTYFVQYKKWQPGASPNDFDAAANWAGGTSNSFTDGSGLPAANWNSGPAQNWIATFDNNTPDAQILNVNEDTKMLAMTMQGETNDITLIVDPAREFLVRTELRINDNASINLDDAKLVNIREIEINPNGSITGHGTITGQQEILAGIPEFTDQGLLEPEVFNGGMIAPGRPGGLPAPANLPSGGSFAKTEDFEAYGGSVNSDIGTVSADWQSTANYVVVSDSGNIVLRSGWGDGSVRGAALDLDVFTITDDSNGTITFQIKAIDPGTDIIAQWHGLSDKFGPDWSDLEVRMNFANNISGATGLSYAVGNGGSMNTLKQNLSYDTWYEVTLDVNHATDSFDLYWDGNMIADDYALRNGAGCGDLIYWMAMDNKLGLTYFDNIAMQTELPEVNGIVDLDSTGTLTIEGDYTQTNSGELALQLGGTDNSDVNDVSYDNLVVTGHTELDGALTVELVDGYVPSEGDSFIIIDANSVSGTFNLIDDIVATSDDNYSFKVLYTANSVTLNYCSAPDYDCSGVVEIDDLAYLISVWLGNDAKGDIAPAVAGDGDVNLEDLAALALKWMD